ncbi:hypothetical protein EDD18DRAFT_1351578 [Armillaria luteobubalina]|uniref:Uncharacterized protein n=1 Tax=Armillaria luteobubalina TaxID=153913 RepID=A0AA39Q870_9AGAR|nr:hypothetical protein EDD18DRAFT_1351578 [Armillaria luteobubalina]
MSTHRRMSSKPSSRNSPYPSQRPKSIWATVTGKLKDSVGALALGASCISLTTPTEPAPPHPSTTKTPRNTPPLLPRSSGSTQRAPRSSPPVPPPKSPVPSLWPTSPATAPLSTSQGSTSDASVRSPILGHSHRVILPEEWSNLSPEQRERLQATGSIVPITFPHSATPPSESQPESSTPLPSELARTASPSTSYLGNLRILEEEEDDETQGTESTAEPSGSAKEPEWPEVDDDYPEIRTLLTEGEVEEEYDLRVEERHVHIVEEISWLASTMGVRYMKAEREQDREEMKRIRVHATHEQAVFMFNKDFPLYAKSLIPSYDELYPPSPKPMPDSPPKPQAMLHHIAAHHHSLRDGTAIEMAYKGVFFVRERLPHATNEDEDDDAYRTTTMTEGMGRGLEKWRTSVEVYWG